MADPAVVLYPIDPVQSRVRFIIDETTMGGVVRTVVGATDQVAGDILVHFKNPAASEFGVIRINARTLRTDSTMRDQKIRSQIIESARDDYEFVELQPVETTGLPDLIRLQNRVQIGIRGDLTIRDVTISVDFQRTVSAVSAERLEASVGARIFWPDFELNIPFALGIVGVNKDVLLEIDLVAVAVEIRPS